MDLNPFTAGITGVTKAVGGLVKTIFGDKSARQAAKHQENVASENEFASEFRVLPNRTAWDSFVDGLNRLPRPTLAFLVIAYFVLSYADPTQFQLVNVGLDTIPNAMWGLLSAVVSFYFVARELKKRRDKLSMSQNQFNEMMRRRDVIKNASKAQNPDISDSDYRKEMKDTTKPLSNAAIMRWNEEHKSKNKEENQ